MHSVTRTHLETHLAAQASRAAVTSLDTGVPVHEKENINAGRTIEDPRTIVWHWFPVTSELLCFSFATACQGMFLSSSLLSAPPLCSYLKGK